MTAPKLTAAQREWFAAIVESAIDESAARVSKYEKELQRFPNGPVRIAHWLHPRMVAEKAFGKWLADAGRAVLRGES